LTTKSTTPGSTQSALGLAGFLLVCFIVAGIGAHAAQYYIPHWYDLLVKPRFTPPDWTFGPACFLGFASMAVAAWMIWRMPRRNSRSRSALYASSDQGSARLDALIVFFITLGFSLLWMEAFFHTHRLLVSAMVILVLWIAMAFTIALFWRVKPLAGLLLVPCLALVTFYTALNLVLLRLN
jgi:benzodiazapine receptor